MTKTDDIWKTWKCYLRGKTVFSTMNISINRAKTSISVIRRVIAFTSCCYDARDVRARKQERQECRYVG